MFDKRYFNHLDNREIKRLTKKLKEASKDVRNGRLRKYFPHEYIKEEDIFDFLMLQNKFTIEAIEAERKEKYNIIVDPKSIQKYGFDRKKEDINLVRKFIEDTSIKSAEHYDVEFEIKMLEKERRV